MVPGKLRVVATALVVWLVQWTLCGCAGGPGSGGGSGVTSPGETTNSSPFAGGVGVSPYLGGSQGVATDPAGTLYVSSTRELTAYNAQWGVIWDNANPLAGMPAAVHHLGDVEYSNGYLYAPVEAWNGCGSFAPVFLAVYNAGTGQLVTWSDITADGHEASAVAVVPASNQVVVTSFCPNENGFTTLWNYDLNTLTTNPPGSPMVYSSTTTLSSAISWIQGISWNADAQEFAISADVDGTAGSLWLATYTGDVTGPIYVVPTAVGIELEGVDYTSDDLYYLESGYVYGIGTVPAPPIFSVAPGVYCSAQMITISDTTAGATIYYTMNGTMPTTGSTVYSGPITVSSSETLNAVAAANGFASSAKSTAAYTIDASACASGAPAF